MTSKMNKLAAYSNLDVYGLGKDKAKWDMRLEAYTSLIVEECIEQFRQTRVEPDLQKFIMEGLKK